MKTFIITVLLTLLMGSAHAAPVSTAFTYQGELNQLGAPANGSFDFQFELFGVDANGTAVGDTILTPDVTVSEGVFTVELDFGSAVHNGEQLWLEIGVREGADDGDFTLLAPRQKITAVPYALQAESVAGNAVGSDEVDPGQVQLRVSAECATGSSIRSIAADGTVTCETIPEGSAGPEGPVGPEGPAGPEGPTPVIEPLANIVNVAKSGGDFTDIGDALASITDASAENPYLIRIAPGVYTETTGIDLKSFVNVEGSGQGVTVIRGIGGEGNPFSNGSAAAVRAANITAELRHLTVESVTSGSSAVAVRIFAGTDALRLKYVTAVASGGTGQTFGVINIASSPRMEHIEAQAAAASSNSFGIYNYQGSNPRMQHITAASTSGTTSSGIRNQSDSFPTMIDVSASATGGDANYGLETYQTTAGEILIHRSTFSGATASSYNYFPISSVTLIASQLNGPVNGAHTCLDSDNGDGQPLDTACQAITSGDAVTWDDVAGIPADLLDGDDDSGLDPANIVWVAKSGGDYTLPSAALSAITDATAENPYLIRIAPGIYNDTLTLKSYVSIEGSGQEATIIRNNIGGFTYIETTTGVIHADGPITAEVRSLSVESLASGKHYQIALSIQNGGSELTISDVDLSSTSTIAFPYAVFITSTAPTLNRVTLRAELASGTATKTVNALRADDSNGLVLNNVTAYASGGVDISGGIELNRSSVLMNHVQSTGNGAVSAQSEGLYANESQVVMHNTTLEALGGTVAYVALLVENSTLTATNSTIISDQAGSSFPVYGISSTVRLANVAVDTGNGFANSASTWVCRQVYDIDTLAGVACP